ncbi:hypothetical protein HMPREF0322_04589 [Desulfitobacterium hafniense DP7]|uniref:Uncharacterized protein n=1 Tax=Desulfitobacterium hafniense DP7 TaxID=537010 RepID=G9XUD0_DESHA|nr:hypothetical protein HMPREF0322_04589 [Desulfitobacterium hafniense DP7]
MQRDHRNRWSLCFGANYAPVRNLPQSKVGANLSLQGLLG